ncbi:MAG TPA: nucleotidyltransferase family protein [Pyrinomonadaceae bacterium]
MTLSEKTCAAFILRLLLDDDAPARLPDGVAWEDLARISRRNVVLVRLSERLQGAGVRPPSSFAAAVEAERRLNDEKMRLVRHVSRACEEAGVPFILAKAFHHHPDMGDDVDLYVLGRSTSVDAVVLKGLSVVAHKRSLTDRLAAARCYSVHGSKAKLDIHHGRMWAYGEHDSFIAVLIRNARRVPVEGAEFSMPSPEDLLVVEATQRVYGRSSIRLAPVVNTIATLRSGALDWDYVLRTAQKFGALPGLSCYLTYVNQIHADIFGEELLTEDEGKALVTSGWGRVEFAGGAYRFPHLRVARKVYLKMFRSAALAGNWKSLSRLCLTPFVAAAAIARKSVN